MLRGPILIKEVLLSATMWDMDLRLCRVEKKLNRQLPVQLKLFSTFVFLTEHNI